MEEKRTSDEVIKLLNKLYYENRRSIGEVVGQNSKSEKQLKLPLAGVDVEAEVIGRVADVKLTQKYRNCFEDNLEATYTFPLTASVSVYSVEMHVADRVIKGQIEERAKAREDYQQAIEAGKRACLMEQERDEIFTMSVGNIEPDEIVTIEIRYCETLTYFEDGSTEVRVPLVVPPKYVPGEPVAREQVGSGVTLDTDRVQDASRISPPRLVDGFNPETDLNISVSIATTHSKLDHTTNVRNLACSQHATKVDLDDGSVAISLANKNELLDRDFVLRWQLATNKIESAFLAVKNKKEKLYTGMLSLIPPAVDSETQTGRDVIFLLDRSGSMHGEKMVSARKACKFLLSSLGPSDRFAVNAFDDRLEWFESPLIPGSDSSKLVRADEEGIKAGIDFLTGVDACGGTEIGQALKAACGELSRVGKLQAPVIVLITDGHIGNESHVLNIVQSQNQNIRVFTVGVDTAVNYGFLERISNLSGGTSSFVNPGDELEEAMRRIARTIGEPLIKDIEIKGINCSIEKATVTPSMVPELFRGRTADLFFQFKPRGKEKPKILVSGMYSDGCEFSQELTVARKTVKPVAKLWARSVINDLEDQFRKAVYDLYSGDRDDINKAIIKLSKEHSILSRLTAFTVIDNQVIKTKELDLRKAVQPVHNPSGWSQSNSAFPHRSRAFGASSPAAGSSAGSWGSAPPGAVGFGGGSSTNTAWGAPPAQSPPPDNSSFGSIRGIGKFLLDESEIGKLSNLYQGAPDAEKVESRRKQDDERQIRLILKKLSGLGAKEGLEAGQITEPLLKLIEAVDRFFHVWSKAWTEIEDGNSVDIEQFKAVCKELVEALDDHPASYDMPKLRRFLQYNTRSFISALEAPNHTICALKALKKQLNIDYDQAFAEAEAVLIKATGKNGAFWQFTV